DPQPPIKIYENTDNVTQIDPLNVSFRTSVGPVLNFAEAFRLKRDNVEGVPAIANSDVPNILSADNSQPIGIIKVSEDEIIALATRTITGRKSVAIAVTNHIEAER